MERKAQCGGALLSEVCHYRPRKLPHHSHELAYFVLLLDGSYQEHCTSQAMQYEPFQLGFHPAHLEHSDEIGESGARFFCIEIHRELLNSLADLDTPKVTSPRFADGEAFGLATRLYLEFRNSGADGIAAEALLLEILSIYQRERTPRRPDPPHWLRHAVEFVHDSFCQPLRFTEIAGAIGVHPVHLARLYRRCYGDSLGALCQRLRVQRASRLIAGTDMPLADIGVSAGFADQSHFTRVFRNQLGTTPGEFRRVLRPGSESRRGIEPQVVF